jgi:hypothetical protein
MVAQSRVSEPTLGATGRVVALIIALVAASPLAIAATLTPATEGIGTHTGLGLPACGWATMAGIPCPSCGMTTAFSWAARGNLLSSLIAQPMGMLLAVAAAMTALAGLWAAATGAAVQRPIAASVLRPWAGWIALGLLLGAWGWKIWALQAGVTP